MEPSQISQVLKYGLQKEKTRLCFHLVRLRMIKRISKNLFENMFGHGFRRDFHLLFLNKTYTNRGYFMSSFNTDNESQFIY